MTFDVVGLSHEEEECPDDPLDLALVDNGGDPGFVGGWWDKFGDGVQFLSPDDRRLPVGRREEELRIVDVECQTPSTNAELVAPLVVVGQVSSKLREGSKRQDAVAVISHDDGSTFEKRLNGAVLFDLP